ncbi:MAG: hypothetical protein U0133_01460 [Gemmatimonadales bacterium]
MIEDGERLGRLVQPSEGEGALVVGLLGGPAFLGTSLSEAMASRYRPTWASTVPKPSRSAGVPTRAAKARL